MVRDEDDVPPAVTGTPIGLSVAVGPSGETIDERTRGPEKPFRLVKVTAEVTEDP